MNQLLHKISIELKYLFRLRGHRIAMVKEYTSSSGSLSARLTDVSMEIDDDDEDVILVILELSNESAVPLGGVDIQIKSSSGAIFKPREEITSLSPGSTRAFSFDLGLTLEHGHLVAMQADECGHGSV